MCVCVNMCNSDMLEYILNNFALCNTAAYIQRDKFNT